jgi:hypothetical protein
MHFMLKELCKLLILSIIKNARKQLYIIPKNILKAVCKSKIAVFSNFYCSKAVKIIKHKQIWSKIDFLSGKNLFILNKYSFLLRKNLFVIEHSILTHFKCKAVR